MLPFLCLCQVQRSLMACVASLAANMDILENLPEMKRNPSNVEKLAVLLARSLQKGARLHDVQAKMFEMTEKITDHKFKYESALATTLTTLISNVTLKMKQQEDAKRTVAPKSHVIKSQLKPKVFKAAEPPRNIHQIHLKVFLEVVAKNGQHATMQAAGVPAALIKQTVGEIIDPVVGGGPADPNIWGPVV